MTEVAYDILTGWFLCLDQHTSVPVFKESVGDVEGNYILLRIESESSVQNNTAFLKNPVIVVEVVTKQQNSVNAKTAWDIMNEVSGLVFNSPGSHNIIVSGLYQIDEAGTTTIQEEDATPRIYRVVKRFLNQTIK